MSLTLSNKYPTIREFQHNRTTQQLGISIINITERQRDEKRSKPENLTYREQGFQQLELSFVTTFFSYKSLKSMHIDHGTTFLLTFVVVFMFKTLNITVNY